MSQLIRKEGKARWVYRCDLCAVTLTAVDRLRILEARNRHVRGNLPHLGKALAEAMEPVVEFVNGIALAAESFGKLLFDPPKNLPHDPILLKDRRKWGGR
ncbi:hypothetical protein [Arthrobacter sp. fls2-241-R2A-172]|uniref:hypothetical protein n=1 Tax=Arthrobacter sp. fls2-241-R2A-172 TaxID=3040325 RepID=UPI002550E5B7|nr:hypothetical protein [Arthrobacter sp. fls2-241-R2A-172]